jgi:bla regulator protein blaR1
VNSLQWTQIFVSLLCQTSLLLGGAILLDKYITSSRTRVRFWSYTYITVLLLLTSALVLPRLQLLHPWSLVEPTILVDVSRAQHFVGVSVLAVWILGMLVMASSWATRSFRLRRLLNRLNPLTPDQQSKVSSQFDADDLLVDGKPVLLLQGDEQFGPFCYQLHSPLVVLPPSLFVGDVEDLKNVLRHELTHLRSRHAMQLFLERAAQIVFWFHPLVWASSRQASLVREFECDDAVAGNRLATIAYLKTLIRIAEASTTKIEGTLAIGRTPSQLKLRSLRLMNLSTTAPQPCRGWYPFLPIVMGLFLSQVWLPTNPLSSPKSYWSAWPAWTASLLHEVGVPARDFERFDPHIQLHELMMREHQDELNNHRVARH